MSHRKSLLGGNLRNSLESLPVPVQSLRKFSQRRREGFVPQDVSRLVQSIASASERCLPPFRGISPFRDIFPRERTC